MNIHLFALLFFGHTVLNHLPQDTATTGQRRSPARQLLLRAITYAALAALLTDWSDLGFAMLAVAGQSCIDWFDRPERHSESVLRTVVVTGLHFSTLLVAAAWATRDSSIEKPITLMAGLAVMVAAAILAWRSGSRFTALVLRTADTDLPKDEEGADAAPPLGRVIGILERLLIVVLVLVGAWAGIGLILAAKSIARFKELENRRFGEYYLVGTLTSVLIAILIGLLASTTLGLLGLQRLRLT